MTQKTALRVWLLFQCIKQILSQVMVFELLRNEIPEGNLNLGHFDQPEIILLPLCLFAMQAAFWPRGWISITLQQPFHFPPEAKKFQSLEMFLIMSVVYECYMITTVYIKNTCSFQEFLNFSQNFIHKLTLRPLFLSRHTVFWNVT